MDDSISEHKRMEEEFEEENNGFVAVPSGCCWQKSKNRDM